MGGCKDSSFLEGHGFTYEGSQPGCFVKALAKLGCGNGGLFLDECDKIGSSNGGSSDVSSTLLHVLDPMQNYEFKDKYLDEMQIDLSKIWFILSMNNTGHLDDALTNRLHIINVPGYEVKDKVEIMRKYLIPITLANVGLKPSNIKFTKEALMFMASNMSEEKGVRNLKGWLFDIISKIGLVYQASLKNGTLGSLKVGFYSPKNIKFPMTVTADTIRNMSPDKIREISHLYI
jgi:ATP-dependent Lon protease